MHTNFAQNQFKLRSPTSPPNVLVIRPYLWVDPLEVKQVVDSGDYTDRIQSVGGSDREGEDCPFAL